MSGIFSCSGMLSSCRDVIDVQRSRGWVHIGVAVLSQTAHGAQPEVTARWSGTGSVVSMVVSCIARSLAEAQVLLAHRSPLCRARGTPDRPHHILRPQMSGAAWLDLSTFRLRSTKT